jgi:anaerobic magnesium-protoporphyrin IX monomethyl ester cyclase
MARVVLFIPNSRWFDKRPWVAVPYAALILTAILKNSHEFTILDANGANMSADDCREQLQRLIPDFVLVTAASFEYHRQVHQALAIAREAAPRAITVLGGVYPTTLPEEAAKDPNADWLFMYHAEERLEPFLRLVAENPAEARQSPGICYRDDTGVVVINPPTSHIGDVSKMARPDYSLIKLDRYLQLENMDYQHNAFLPTGNLLTSYGCPYNCVFCASRTISGRRLVFRPLEDVLDEIDYLAREHGIRNFIFHDDALLADRKRTVALLEALIDRNEALTWKAVTVSAWHLDDDLLKLMARSGCTQITISVESGSQRVLEEVIRKPLRLEIIPPLVKKCRDVGIAMGANFVIGTPGETWEEIRQSVRFAEECDFDLTHFHIATPLPQTDLYRICREKGYLPDDFSFLDPLFFGFADGFITTEEFTPFELKVLRSFEWDRINFSTEEKRKRVASLYGVTLEKLQEHREMTRRKLGIHF